VIHRAFRYRLQPTAEQAQLFEQFAGVTRLVYNLALEQRERFWRQYSATVGERLSSASQRREISQLRSEFDFIEAVNATPLHEALRDLDKAFRAFFRGDARYPTPRRKGANDSFRFTAQRLSTIRLNAKWSAVRVPKIGFVKFRDTHPMRGRPLNLTISKAANGWHASFVCEIEHEAPANDLPAVGIDRGVANTLALSTGELLSTPDLSHLERRRKHAQRILARRVRGSNRYRRQRRRVSSLSAKIARCRADWRHKATLDIASRFGTVTLEALQIPNMTRRGTGKRGLNRSIIEQGWGAFERVLAYKLDERGGTLEKVNPAYTSQVCSACGTIDRASRESQASFACRHCGSAMHADTNAALNILRRGTAFMCVEGSGYAPDEARTINLAA
jgi:putative transposase